MMAAQAHIHSKHIPVMLDEVIATIAPHKGKTYVDATFGAGGYSRAILNAADCNVIAIDRDPNAQLLADALARDFPGHFLFLRGRFSQMKELLAQVGVAHVDGIVLDIGVSSMQLDEPGRGFSFQHDAPLDMRMGADGQTAADLIANETEQEIARILYVYGEERASRAIAKAIVAQRKIAPITTTLELAALVGKVRGVEKRAGVNPATRTFQALRIAVNDELRELECVLNAAETLLRPEGRLVVVTFHSLEDRIVKQFMREACGEIAAVSRHDMAAYAATQNKQKARFSLLYKKSVQPTEKELKHNPRARSAKLRAVVKLEAA